MQSDRALHGGSSSSSGSGGASSSGINEHASTGSLPPGFHSFQALQTVFRLPKRYTLVQPIGQGAYGSVIAAHDSHLGLVVAVKKIPRVFENIVCARRVLREIRLLRRLNHENVVQVIDVLGPVGQDFSEIYIVTEMMQTDLYQVLQTSQVLSSDHIQYFIYQLLRGLKYMHSAGVIHRDLKPSNLLLTTQCDLRICDLGLARGTSVSSMSTPGTEELATANLTSYVATRWYRAPEVLLSWPHYTQAVDIWSVGCILAELISRRPVFPGRATVHQLQLIFAACGMPSAAFLAQTRSEKARSFIHSMAAIKSSPLESMFPNLDPNAMDLIKRLLALDPSDRITAQGALEHPYFSGLHDPTDEPVASGFLDWSWDDCSLDRHTVRRLCYEEIRELHPAAPPWSSDLFFGLQPELNAPNQQIVMSRTAMQGLMMTEESERESATAPIIDQRMGRMGAEEELFAHSTRTAGDEGASDDGMMGVSDAWESEVDAPP